MWHHWVLRSNHPHEPFSNFETTEKMWKSLSLAFPNMLSAVLMPNHLHLILPFQKDNQKNYHRLGGVISHIGKSNGVSHLWQRIPPPTLIPDQHHLKRQLRYVALNPCRKSLCSDPLEWWWSTYREIMGGTVNPIVSEDRIASALGINQAHFRVRFHAYTSGDPSVHVEGTNAPVHKSHHELKYQSLHQILLAVSAALRMAPSSIHESRSPLRPYFIHLAYRMGWQGQAQQIAEISKMSTHGVQRILRLPPPQELNAAELCLSDPRFTSHYLKLYYKGLSPGLTASK